MEKVTDWATLWRQLAETRYWRGYNRPEAREQVDAWRERAREYDARIQRRWSQPDSTRDWILSQVDAGTTVLDIGAGTGRWAMLLARHVCSVTAVEPAPAMIEVMTENLAEEGIANVQVIEGSWPHVQVGPHDVSLCAHGMYSSPDLPAFARAMVQATRHRCYLLLRAPMADSVMAQIARHVWGQPHDSPNLTVAYNVLLDMGIHANVLMEDSGLWEPETHASLEQALCEVKRRFGLAESSEYDGYLQDVLSRQLAFRDGRYIWPREVRSALVYWDVGASG
jgi:2-polyprenyl-3-methyl-5-hydroxy-6-metoxy-1,4-benzoquinol methylase